MLSLAETWKVNSSPVVPMVWEGTNAVNFVRKTLGATDPQESTPGTIRADFGQEIGRNVIHGSDSTASAEREINLFFKESEFVEYTLINEEWVHE